MSAYRDRLLSLAHPVVINLPDISDVSFPSMIGAIPAKKKKKRGVQYKGVRLGRPPTQFEAQVLSLAEIPLRLDAAHDRLREDPLADWPATILDLASYGFREVCRELHRQGAPDEVLETPVTVDIAPLVQALAEDRAQEFAKVREGIADKLAVRRLRADVRERWLHELTDRRVPAMHNRYAARAVHDAFALGRATAIATFRRPRVPFDLVWRNAEGQFISQIEAVNEGVIAVDMVIQTAVLDESTCDECEAVDGEVMDFGDDRMEELRPPYVKCHGGDRCRCLQIAVLDNGAEINVEELDEDALG